jgi:D-hydroxyproline dehydrogenase subunit alpha
MVANTEASCLPHLAMPESPDVLVVGAGLAGMAAACRLGEQGLRVWLVEQAPVWGGAVLRQSAHHTDERLKGPHQARWQDLVKRQAQLGASLQVRCGVQFSGMDADGLALLVNLADATHVLIRPRALVLATGASERVHPRRGWHLPGVMTAGAIQVGMKTSAAAPAGRVLLAGSGPLLLAVGAQLVRMGCPPVAIVEAATPQWHWRQALQLPSSYWREAAGYALTLWRAGVPVLTGTQVHAIEALHAGLRVHMRTTHGALHRDADVVGLHDGIDPDHYGPAAPQDTVCRRAGDCHEALGARAAAAHGDLVGQEVGALLQGRPAQAHLARRSIERERAAQTALQEIFWYDWRKALQTLPPETVVCRCEGRTLSDLRALGPKASVREIRLLGRFGMGACQGRFCARAVQQLVEPDGAPAISELMGSHWPAKPLSIRALVTQDPAEVGGEDRPD